MVATVIETFVDKFGIQHREGESITIDDSKRIKNLSERGIIKVAEEVVTKPATPTRKKKVVKDAK